MYIMKPMGFMKKLISAAKGNERALSPRRSMYLQKKVLIGSGIGKTGQLKEIQIF